MPNQLDCRGTSQHRVSAQPHLAHGSRAQKSLQRIAPNATSLTQQIFGDVDVRSGAENDGSFDDTLHFLKIAWPPITHQHAFGLGTQAFKCLSQATRTGGDDTVGEHYDVIATFRKDGQEYPGIVETQFGRGVVYYVATFLGVRSIGFTPCLRAKFSEWMPNASKPMGSKTSFPFNLWYRP